MKSLSRVQPSATPWTAAFQASPSTGFSRQEYQSGVPLPSPILKLINKKEKAKINTIKNKKNEGTSTDHVKAYRIGRDTVNNFTPNNFTMYMKWRNIF